VKFQPDLSNPLSNAARVSLACCPAAQFLNPLQAIPGAPQLGHAGSS
jgi:hypothetical protein